MARIEYYQVGDVSDFDKGWREELAEAVNGHDDSIIALVAADVALDARLDTAETDIDALQAADIALDSRLDTAEATISSHGTRLTADEADIASLQTSNATKLNQAQVLRMISLRF